MTNIQKNYFKSDAGQENDLVIGGTQTLESGSTLNVGGTVNMTGTVYGSDYVHSLLVTVTLAEINAGEIVLAGVAGKTITVLDFEAKVAGTFTTVTSVELEDTNGTPVAIASTAVAGLTDGAILNEVEANTTMGAGYLGALTAGAGIAVTKTGSDAAGGTSITYRVLYTIS